MPGIRPGRVDFAGRAPCPSRSPARRVDHCRTSPSSRSSSKRPMGPAQSGTKRHRSWLESGAWLQGGSEQRRCGIGGRITAFSRMKDARSRFQPGPGVRPGRRWVHTDNPSVVDHVIADESLAVEDRMPSVQASALLADQDEPVARPDLAAKPDVLHAPECDESTSSVEMDLLAEEAGELRGGLADHDAGHQRIVGHVAANPKLVGPRRP